MKLKILGSAAAEGWPGLFCECATCAEARRLGGRNIRRRTAYVLDETLLVDFGPDAYWQSIEFGVDLLKVDDILFTHSHADHLNPLELSWRRKGYSQVERTLRVHGNVHVLDRIRRETATPDEKLHLTMQELRSGATFAVGPWTVTAFAAQHASPEEDALNYALQKDGKTILIGHDTGWWPDASWEQVLPFHFDLAILECTYGMLNPDARSHHLGVASTVAFRDELRRRGTLGDASRVIVNHFSHNGGANHDALREWFAPHGLEVAYDGLEVEL